MFGPRPRVEFINDWKRWTNCFRPVTIVYIGWENGFTFVFVGFGVHFN